MYWASPTVPFQVCAYLLVFSFFYPNAQNINAHFIITYNKEMWLILRRVLGLLLEDQAHLPGVEYPHLSWEPNDRGWEQSRRGRRDKAGSGQTGGEHIWL